MRVAGHTLVLLTITVLLLGYIGAGFLARSSLLRPEPPILLPNESPSAAFLWAPETPLAGDAIVFTAADSDPDGTITSLRWDFGDGAVMTGEDFVVTHKYVLAGRYTVYLTVTDDQGATNASSRSLIVYGSLDFETVEFGYWGAWDVPHAFLITNETRWREVWHIIHAREEIRYFSPPIDFAESTMIAVFYGIAPTSGYAVLVREVSVTGDGLHVALEHFAHSGRGIILPAVTHPYHLVAVAGTWTNATFEVSHVIPGEGLIAFRTGQASYQLGDVIEFSLRNRMARNLTLVEESPWRIYRDVDGEWLPVETHLSVQGDITLESGMSRSWRWTAATQTGDDGLVRVEPGFYRIELWAFRRLTFFFECT